MSGSIPYVDILIFAIIAIFLGLRLRSVLGKRTGFEQDQSRDQDMVEVISTPQPQQQAPASGQGIAAIQKADHAFSEKEFVKGAGMAYGMILEAFAEGDTEQLKSLLGYEMMNSFSDAIRDRMKSGENLSIDLVNLDHTRIHDARLVEGLAIITVEFKSQQKRLLRDDSGTIVDGDEDQIETFVDLWTFERDISSRDPNWLLVETESVQ
ncbi:MAG: Tim44/TimA family putative adaptor protein [Candidatus Puniceispirillales bacterium]